MIMLSGLTLPRTFSFRLRQGPSVYVVVCTLASPSAPAPSALASTLPLLASTNSMGPSAALWVRRARLLAPSTQTTIALELRSSPRLAVLSACPPMPLLSITLSVLTAASKASRNSPV
ncbi:hypothetical protein BDV98DRAFT_605548 [Pterulicium gracile]|uniref:Uncharacterized protein n=1 Tax=Pterulicium gracile TaxID=1884261 RepID=A0A5C3QNZ2_9AGAR|nr:hypothetical protein BDV98DRAFT_605548 [Pterula gracilis]